MRFEGTDANERPKDTRANLRKKKEKKRIKVKEEKRYIKKKKGGVGKTRAMKVFMGKGEEKERERGRGGGREREKRDWPLWMTRRLSTKSRQDYAAILDVGKYLVAEEAVE